MLPIDCCWYLSIPFTCIRLLIRRGLKLNRARLAHVLRSPNDSKDSLNPTGRRVQIHASTSNLTTRNPASTFAQQRKQPGDFLPTPVRGRTDFQIAYPLSSEDIVGECWMAFWKWISKRNRLSSEYVPLQNSVCRNCRSVPTLPRVHTVTSPQGRDCAVAWESQGSTDIGIDPLRFPSSSWYVATIVPAHNASLTY
jgi:hypothetical protein